MAKKLIRLTESDLHKIVKESVKIILREKDNLLTPEDERFIWNEIEPGDPERIHITGGRSDRWKKDDMRRDFGKAEGDLKRLDNNAYARYNDFSNTFPRNMASEYNELFPNEHAYLDSIESDYDKALGEIK